MVVKEEPDPLSDVAPEVPSPIIEIVQRAMRKKPEDRFASAADLRDALVEASRGFNGGEEAVTRSVDGGEESTQRVVRTVLVVEADETLAAGLKETLEGSGYGVETAADGREALDRLAQSDPPAMILLDLMMPRMDGWQFLQEWQKVPGRPRIPIVLLSGVGAIPDAPGVADFLRKPVSSARLLACVQRYCR
jgi:CheY-like chemotaxis protein